jgi:hypothetical protein
VIGNNKSKTNVVKWIEDSDNNLQTHKETQWNNHPFDNKTDTFLRRAARHGSKNVAQHLGKVHLQKSHSKQ